MLLRFCIWVALFFSGFSIFQFTVDAAFDNPILEARSNTITSISGSGDPIEVSRSLGFKVLNFVKLLISGIALIYLVMIGAYMVIFSENEERIKTQRKQITYALVGFLFLNIPGVMYQVFFATPKYWTSVTDVWVMWSDFSNVIFWDLSGMQSTLANIIAFFQIFIFGIAILLFTWWLFRLVLSAGDEERVKAAKNRILYGTLGLIFLGFVKIWWSVIATGKFGNSLFSITNIAGKIMSLGVYFAGPVAIFFLIIGSYYYITSGGDEERVKKWKNIILNTFIATIILLASYSFLLDLVNL